MGFATAIIETLTPWLPIIGILSLLFTALNYFAGRRVRKRATHEATPTVRAIINRKHYEGGWRSVQLHIVEPAEPLNFQCSNWRIDHARLLKPATAELARAKDDNYSSGTFDADKPVRELKGREAGSQRFALNFFIKFKQPDDRSESAKFKVTFSHIKKRRRHKTRIWATVPKEACGHSVLTSSTRPPLVPSQIWTNQSFASPYNDTLIPLHNGCSKLTFNSCLYVSRSSVP